MFTITEINVFFHTHRTINVQKIMLGFTITCIGGCKGDSERFGERMGMHYEEDRERQVDTSRNVRDFMIYIGNFNEQMQEIQQIFERLDFFQI